MKSNEQKLLQILSNNDVTFFIPPYQRNYEWTKEQCEVFLGDVLKTTEHNIHGSKTEHFFGSVTYFEDESSAYFQPAKLILIDGQQRITTTMLFLVAIRDLINDEGQKKYINDKYLKNNNCSDESEYKIKLKQVESDWETYKKIILGIPVTSIEKNVPVYQNYIFFKNSLAKRQNNGDSLQDFIQYGLNCFSIVTLELQPAQNPWENPQEIFESMNSIGKPLSLADLVRNYLLLGLDSKTQEDYYHRYWLEIEKVLSGQISGFIRDYMQCVEMKSYKKATESNSKALYSQFKDIFIGWNAEKLLDSLSQYAVIYSKIINKQLFENKSIDYALRDILELKTTVSYSFLMMLLMSWKKGVFNASETADILFAFRTYLLRRRLVGLAKGENKVFPGLVNKLQDLAKATDKKMAMFQILSKLESNLRLPNDIEIMKAVKDLNFYNFSSSKMYLSLIEESLTKHYPESDDAALQIEHIMPQTLTAVWKEQLGDDFERIHQEKVNVIGNLTLIRHNQELGNKAFSEKKETYRDKAGLQIAKSHITDHEVWDEKAIDDRTSWLIDILLQDILPIPESMRRTNNYTIKSGRHLSFTELQIIGEEINFIADPSITARVVGDKEVEFEGENWRLSPLCKELYTRMGKCNRSGAYSGAEHWEYDGVKIADIL